jgi:hypothetical protein
MKEECDRVLRIAQQDALGQHKQLNEEITRLSNELRQTRRDAERERQTKDLDVASKARLAYLEDRLRRKEHELLVVKRERNLLLSAVKQQNNKKN